MKTVTKRCKVCSRVFAGHGKTCPACRQKQYRQRVAADRRAKNKALSMDTYTEYTALCALSPELATVLNGIYDASETADAFDRALRQIAIGVRFGMEIAAARPDAQPYSFDAARDDE
jgi:hypothetical protein